MKYAFILGAVISGLLGLLPTAQAELRVNQNRFTLDVQEASLEYVLRDLSRQGSIAITILDNGALDNAIVSKQFANLSIEEGLHRLLLGWNYGLTTDHRTGRVQHVLIASKRTNPPNELPVARPTTSPSEETPTTGDPFYREGTTSDEFPPKDSEAFYQDIEFSAEDEFPEDRRSDDLSPDLREAILRTLQDLTEPR